MKKLVTKVMDQEKYKAGDNDLYLREQPLLEIIKALKKKEIVDIKVTSIWDMYREEVNKKNRMSRTELCEWLGAHYETYVENNCQFVKLNTN
jgi:hypothetical protein